MEQPELSKQDIEVLKLAKKILAHKETKEAVEAVEVKAQPSTEIMYRSEEADTTELTEYEEFEQAYIDIVLGSGDVLPLIRFLQRKDAKILVREDYVGDVAEFDEPDWIVEGILVRNGLTLIYGASGSGKTTFLMNMADAIQRGEEFFGRQCEQGSVLFIEQDEPAELLKQHREIMGKPNPLLVAKKDMVWEKNHFCRDLGDTLAVESPDVVVVDSYTSLGIEDITRPESGLVFDELRRHARKHGCSICIVHHTSLSGRQMGSSLHEAKVDSMISMTKTREGDTSDTINVTQEKIRGARFEPLILEFQHTSLEMTRAEGTLKDQVKELVEQGINEEEIVNRFSNRQKSTIRRYLRDFRHS